MVEFKIKSVISRFRNIVLSQTKVTNIIRIFFICTISFMVLLLALILKSTSGSKQVLSRIHIIEKHIGEIIEHKNNLDKYVLLSIHAEEQKYLDKYFEIGSEIYNSAKILDILVQVGITTEEKTLLQNALLEIDNAVASDMYVLNLIYLSYNKKLDNAHEFQKRFPLTEDAYMLSPSKKRELASKLLLESFNEHSGKRNNQYFYEFNNAVNERLSNEAGKSLSNVNAVINLMLVFTIVSMILLYITLRLIDHYINKPIMQYTKILENMEHTEPISQQLTPFGTHELVMLADIINSSNKRMNTLLKVYAYGSSIAENFEDTISKILTTIKIEFKFDTLFLLEIYDRQKFKVFTVSGYTNEFDEKISKSYAIPFILKRIRNLNYFHIKINSFKGELIYHVLKEYNRLSASVFSLKSRDKNKRLLLVLSKKEEPLHSGTITMMTLIAQHMSVIFENLHLYGSLFQQLQDRVQAQEDMKKAKEEAEKANTSKTHFLANISHEIRTPLTSILGYSDILSAMTTDEKQLGYIKTINSAGNLLLQLINDVLDMSKIEAGMLNVQYYSFKPRVVFREVEQILHTKILTKGIDLISEIDSNIPEYIMLSETYLRQILINLVGNAIKFTSKGYVKLKAYAYFPNPDKKDIFDLIVDIIDTGIGIEPDSIEKIFEPFTQQSGKNTRRYEGTGLGLAISKNLVNIMDGTLSVVSKPNEGSIFTIKINNVAAAQSEGETLPYEDEEDIVFENAIAAVDECLSGYTLLSDILQKLGIKVIPLQSLYELTEASAEIYPSIVVVDDDDESIDSKLKTIISFTIFNNAYIMVVKKVGTDTKIHDRHLIDEFISRPFIMADIRKTLKKYLYFIKANRQDLRSALVSFDDANITYELKELILREYVPQAESFHGAIKLSELLDFAHQLILDGGSYKCAHLAELGQRLLKSTKNYNMSDIRQDLNKIDEFIGFVKEYSCNMGGSIN